MSEPNQETATSREERLRALLRAADPATAEPELRPEEVAAIRRTILDQARGPGASRSWERLTTPTWRLALAVATLAALALGLAVLLRSARPAPAVREASGPGTGMARPSTVPSPAPHAPSHPSAGAPVAPPPVDRLAGRVPPAEDATTGPAPRKEPFSPPAPVVEPPSAPPLDKVADAAAPTQRPIQLQLTAPGGTRIVWVFEPSTGDG